VTKPRTIKLEPATYREGITGRCFWCGQPREDHSEDGLKCPPNKLRPASTWGGRRTDPKPPCP
jgi:hypothetical protein